MQVARGASSTSESYAAFNARQRVVQRAQYASLSFGQEQRRLRIHLRRILLLHDATATAPQETETTTAETPPALVVPPLQHWRQEAVAREARTARRRASALKIQRLVRRWLNRRSNIELPSTSEWVAVAASVETPTQSWRAVDMLHSDVGGEHVAGFLRTSQTSDFPDTPVTLTEPFQVIVELLGARDLAPSHQYADMDLAVEVRLILQPTCSELGHLDAFAMVSASEDAQWDDQVLQLGIEDPELILRGGAVQVEVFVTSLEPRVALGRVTVALNLLETPLAEKYAMTRWFPLERGRGAAVRQAKGEVRLGIRLLMRNPKSSRYSDDVWVPFEGTVRALSPRPSPRAPYASHATAQGGRKRAPPAKPPLSPRRRNTPSASPPRVSSRQVVSRDRYMRAEAMSPPSSPSSYSSDSNAELSPLKALPSPQVQASSSRRSLSPSGGIVSYTNARKKILPKVNKEGDAEPVRPMSPQRDGVGSSDEPAKPLFLKRKPYKVVFQKLDWSRVSSKTDSNWGASGRTGSSSAARAGTSPRRASAAPTTDVSANRGGSPSKASTHTAFSERLEAVAQQVYTACHVTKATAALAQMRFRNERRQWLQALSPQAATTPSDTNAPSSVSTETTNTPQPLLDDARLHALWAELQSDADGALYASLLRTAMSCRT